jgi:hypothetical protein
MATKESLHVGQRVMFFRMHDKSLQLEGVIKAISPDEDVVQIETVPDGKVLEIATLETAHVEDVRDLTPSPSVVEPVKPTSARSARQQAKNVEE